MIIGIGIFWGLDKWLFSDLACPSKVVKKKIITSLLSYMKFLKKNNNNLNCRNHFNKLLSVLISINIILINTKFGRVHHIFCLLHRLLPWGWQASQSCQFRLHGAKEGDQHGAWYGQMEKITGMLYNPLKSSLSATLRDEKIAHYLFSVSLEFKDNNRNLYCLTLFLLFG